jgi:TLD
MRFPRRTIIQRIIRIEEYNIGRGEEEIEEETVRPLGLVIRKPDAVGNSVVKPVLAQSHSARLLLAKWLPITLRLNNLDLLYSTNSHGRTLERFYSHVKNSKHTVLICEVLRASNESPVILGMYAPQAWRASTKVYGDGGVFLFRLQPNPACWKWHPSRPMKGGSVFDHVDLEDDSSNHTALLEQFMVGTNAFISMGGNPDGSCGLRINEDLTRGESSTATGFDNEPLHGLNKGSVFEIGLLEVYGFVRQIDGRAV